MADLTPETIDRIEQLAVAARGGTTLREGVAAFYVPDDYSIETVDLEKYGTNPRRKQGKFHFDRSSSFIEYLSEHEGAGTLVLVDGERGTFTAYLNGHSETEAGWHDFSATFALKPTPAWIAWTGAAQRWLSQQEFAEFIEDRIGDIAEPPGADLLAVATTFRASTNIEFQSNIRLVNGQVQMTYNESIEGAAGARGDIRIAEQLRLVVQPYEGVADQDIAARLRWRVRDGKVAFTFSMAEEIRRIREAAVEEAVEVIGAGVTAPVLFGSKQG